MFQFSANAVFWCGGALRSIRADCLAGSVDALDGEPGFLLVKDLDERARGKALRLLVSIEGQFRKIGMPITADTVKELLDKLNGRSPRQNFQWLMDQVEMIEGLAAKELGSRFFLYIPLERSKFWPKMNEPNIFGAAVADKFPSAAFDIGNSGVCLATMMFTAAVFHLMRVLEIGLTVLGKEFGVSLEQTNWGPAIGQIESKIRDMHSDPKWKALPDWKERRQFYSQAASHFGFLKDAWRNYTMHGGGRYTEVEAERIFENVKGFMQKLAERLSE